MPDGSITLYPSNWLYNAGVIGFLRVIAEARGESVVENWIQENGTVTIDVEIFRNAMVGDKEIPIPKCMKYLVEYLVNDEDVKEWLYKKDKKGITNNEKYKDIANQLGDFGYKFIRAGNMLFASNMPYQNLVQLS
jgi:CRISPR-associated protein Cst1